MELLQVKDVMTEKVVAVRSSEDLATLHDLMFDNHIRHIPVVDTDDNVVGIVSHRDLVSAALYSSDSLPGAAVQELLRSTKVREIMTTGVETIASDESLEEAAATMLENKYGCLPVTEGTKLVGILTEADFIRVVLDEQRAKARRPRGGADYPMSSVR